MGARQVRIAADAKMTYGNGQKPTYHLGVTRCAPRAAAFNGGPFRKHLAKAR